MPDAAESIAARAVVVLGSPFVVGTNVFAGPMRAESSKIPRKAIFCSEGDGPAAWMRFGSATNNVRKQRVKVYTRDVIENIEALRDRAHALWVGYQRATISGFKSCTCDREPFMLMVTPTDLPVYVVDVTLWLQG